MSYDFGVYQIVPMCNVLTNIPTTGTVATTAYQGRPFFISIQDADTTNLTTAGSFDAVNNLSAPYDQRPFKEGDLFFVQYGPAIKWAMLVMTYTNVSGVEHYQLAAITP